MEKTLKPDGECDFAAFAATEEAMRQWMRTFNSVPTGIVVKLYRAGDEVVEITPPTTVEHDELLPMWGTMWSFDNSADNAWLDDKKNLRAMADCGFRIYQQEDYGYIFGIDGAGYDFYEAHWIPLYKARGLKWHLR
jgi:hypothetical protein